MARGGGRRLTRLALNAFVVCVAMSVLLSVVDGVVRGFGTTGDGVHLAWLTWITDLRYLFEQGIYAAIIFWLGARSWMIGRSWQSGSTTPTPFPWPSRGRTRITSSGSAGATGAG